MKKKNYELLNKFLTVFTNMNSKFGLPMLNLSKIPEDSIPISESSSDDDIIHEAINNMHIRTDLKKAHEQISTPRELKCDNRLYKYKKELACRNIEFIMTESDLRKCHSDQSETLYLQITLIDRNQEKAQNVLIQSSPNILISSDPGKGSKITDRNKDNGKRSRSGSLSVMFSPKNKKAPRSPKVAPKISPVETYSPKISPKLPSDDTPCPKLSPKISSEIDPKIIKVNNIDYSINYKLTDYTYSVFKIKSVYNLITCYGICDSDLSGHELLKSGYDCHNVYIDCNYEVITPEVFDGFQSCMVVCTPSPYSIGQFLNAFQSILVKLKL